MKKFVMTAAIALGALVSSSASAQTAEIEALLAQIAALQAQLGTSTSVSTSGSFVYAGGILKVGSRGQQVMDLQKCLAELGQNPSNNQDGIFGNITKSAVMSFQASKGVAVDGIIGPVTGPLYTAACATSTNPGTGTGSSTSGMSNSEASLEDLNLKDENDAEEDDSKHVATLEFDVEDGDVKIQRIDITFEGVSTPTEDDPWDAFEEITLMADGKEIASEKVDDEDDWLDENGPVFVYRLNNIDYMVEEGDQAEIEIWLTAQNGVDDAGTDADWKIEINTDGIRGIDGAGIDQYLGDTSEEVTFTIDAKGGDESIEINSSSDDLDASSLMVEESSKSDWYDVFVFELEAEENDIDLDELVLTVTTTGDNYEDVVNDIMITIDGDEFDDYDVADEDSLTADVTFDLDKEVTVDADESVEVVVSIEFRKQTGNFSVGETVQVSTVSVEGEGKDDVSDTATVSSETHTLTLADITVEVTDKDASTNDDDSVGYISFTFTVGAEGDDVTFDVADNDDVDGATDDVKFTLTGTDTAIAVAALTNTDGDASFAGGTWTVDEGEEAEFVLDVTFTTVDAGDNGTYRVRLNSVAGVEVDDLSSSVNLSF